MYHVTYVSHQNKQAVGIFKALLILYYSAGQHDECVCNVSNMSMILLQ